MAMSIVLITTIIITITLSLITHLRQHYHHHNRHHHYRYHHAIAIIDHRSNLTVTRYRTGPSSQNAP
eukprot:3320995-Pyramimonas_sp.AAC.1